MECTLGLGCLLFGAVANQSGALGQAKVKGQQRAMLHADGPQGGAINLQDDSKRTVVKFRAVFLDGVNSLVFGHAQHTNETKQSGSSGTPCFGSLQKHHNNHE